MTPPKTRPDATIINAENQLVWMPHSVRLRMSRPIESVPRMWPAEPGGRSTPPTGWIGLYGASRWAKIAIRVIRISSPTSILSTRWPARKFSIGTVSLKRRMSTSVRVVIR